MAALEKLTRFWDTSWTPCKFNSDKCLALEEITSSFSAPITEEHAWAIVFECVKCLHSMVESKPRKVFIVTNTKQILLHQEGRVHESTFLAPGSTENCGGDQGQENSVSKSTSSSTSTSRASTISESKVVQELALVMYAALDIGLKEDEERTLSPGMENLLAHMISAGEGDESHSEKVDTDDEGIEQDHDDFENRGQSPHGGQSQSQHGGQSQHNRGQSPHVPSECLRSTLGLCQSHLSVESEAEDHYRNVCRALVMEAMELSFFLEKTYLAQQESEQSEELKLLARKDWANLWISTMNELRNGVKLKKSNHTKTPIEYALTPYEMLMDDIRSRRYKLNKVMVDGQLPAKVKKDAHDIILEFIRSRPPLKPACNRILRPPPRKYSTPHELLMDGLKSDEAKHQLRKTSGPPERPSPLKQMYQQHEWTDAETTLLRYEEQAAQQAQNGYSAQNGHPAHQKPKTSFAGYEGSRDTYRRPMQRSMSLSNGLQRRNSQRVVIRPDEAFSKFDPENDDDELSDPDLDRTLTPENNNVNKQLHQVRRNSAATTSATTPISSTSGYPISGSVDRMRPKIIRRSRGSSSAGLGTSLSNLTSVSEAEHLTASAAEKASPTLALSHSELTHIRSALSRAKLESLAPDLKSEIVKGNICFLCTKTKFNLFFARRHHCQLCQQNVCSKCISKAKLPEDQRFDNVPVFALSPGQSSPHLVKSSNNNKAFIPITTNSSTKVKLRRSNTLNGRYDRPNSVAGDAPGSSPGILSSLTSISSSNSSGLTLNVCLDCKHAVESMTQQTRQQIQPQNNQPQNQPQQIQPQHNQNPLPDFEPATFQQRRRFSHQDYMRRRSIVTKSLILD